MMSSLLPEKATGAARACLILSKLLYAHKSECKQLQRRPPYMADIRARSFAFPVQA